MNSLLNSFAGLADALILSFTVTATGQRRVKWADRICLDGNGSLVIHGRTHESVVLRDVQDLRIERVRSQFSCPHSLVN